MKTRTYRNPKNAKHITTHVIPSQETSPGSLKLQSSLQNQCARSCHCNTTL